MKLILLAAILWSTSTATLLRCPPKNEVLPYFLGCIRKDIDSDFAGFEAEYTAALRKQVESCFPLTEEEAEEGQCVFTEDDYKKDAFNDTDSLGPCSICRSATSMIRNFMETADEDRMKSFRMAFADTLAADLSTCLGDELAYKQIPDVEGMEHTDSVNKVANLNLFMTSRSKMISCQKDGLGTKTSECLATRGSLAPDMPKHCTLAQTCATNQLNQRCCNTIKDAVTQQCDCLSSKKQHYVNQLLTAKEELEQISTKEECNEIMQSLFQSDSQVNWLETVDEVASSFIQGMKVSFLLNQMCKDTERRIQENDPSLPEHLSNIDGVLKFLALIIDSSVSHLSDRFCHCDIDCSQAYSLKGNRSNRH